MSEEKTDVKITVTAEKKYAYFIDHQWYRAKYVEHTVGEGKYGPWVMLSFEMLSGEMEDGEDAKGKKCTVFTNAECYPGSILYHCIEILSGEAPEVDADIDLSIWYGKKVKAFIEDRKINKKAKDQSRRQSVTKLRKLVAKKKTSK